MGMYVLNLTDCESVLLLDVITHLCYETDINQETGRQKLSPCKPIDLHESQLNIFRSVLTKLSPCLD